MIWFARIFNLFEKVYRSIKAPMDNGGREKQKQRQTGGTKLIPVNKSCDVAAVILHFWELLQMQSQRDT